MPEDRGIVQDAPSVEETLRRMQAKLNGIVPEFELPPKAELAFRINRMKRERNAVILGHNYMEPALYHSVPDYTGDSLELSRISAQTSADVIIFCGVQFMAETAKVLNPNKTVLIPAEKAGCSLAEGIGVEDVRRLRELYPGAPVVTYVNTYAAVKAESDYCCTSGNATAVVRHLFDQGHDHVVFLPDDYLARNTAADLDAAYAAAPEPATPGRKTVVGWNVRCEVHELYTVQDVERLRGQFPDAVILAHPECHPDVIALVDYKGSTKGMLEYIRNEDAPRYILLTECTMADNVAAEFPHREMVRACNLRCKHMNLITLEQTLAALENLQFAIELPGDIIDRARVPIDRMLAIR
ncbi:MAG TPA: quinolinate synthase NadA [Candidatus Hydrogenedentes bacterium]|nr:quinolinate synthase NadA [Candidatus Hydrogenedentota bacterium]HOV75006.1 quinolinate synthase NadA [Candidatus Hydrogenedentota bacterium]